MFHLCNHQALEKLLDISKCDVSPYPVQFMCVCLCFIYIALAVSSLFHLATIEESLTFAFQICRECFYIVFEDEIHRTIVDNNLFKASERVAIGASGGKGICRLVQNNQVTNDFYAIDVLPNHYSLNDKHLNTIFCIYHFISSTLGAIVSLSFAFCKVCVIKMFIQHYCHCNRDKGFELRRPVNKFC